VHTPGGWAVYLAVPGCENIYQKLKDATLFSEFDFVSVRISTSTTNIHPCAVFIFKWPSECCCAFLKTTKLASYCRPARPRLSFVENNHSHSLLRYRRSLAENNPKRSQCWHGLQYLFYSHHGGGSGQPLLRAYSRISVVLALRIVDSSHGHPFSWAYIKTER
jgi:hypothetical protein